MMRRLDAGVLRCFFAVFAIAVLALISVPKSLTGDEALTVALCSGSYSAMLNNVAVEIHLPAYHTLLWIWIKLFGNSLSLLRLFAFLPVGLLVFIGCRKLGRYGFLVLAFSPFLLHLSVELRMYGILALSGMAFLVLLTDLEQSFTKRKYIFLLLVTAFAVWIHYFAWCGVAAAATYLFIRKKTKQALILVSVAVLSVLPWLPNLLMEIQRFGPGSTTPDSGDLLQLATPVQMLKGIPFSIAGTLLRFAGGNAVFRFNLFSVREMSIWVVIGGILFAAMLVAAWKGRKKVVLPVYLLLLFTLLPLSLLRPSARHFAVAYPAFAAVVAAGLYGKGKTRRILRLVIPILSLTMTVPFLLRTTLPQRCSFDRDFREAAVVAGTAASENNEQLVIYLDTYSLLGVLYHLGDEGISGITVVQPHEALFASCRYFYLKPTEALSFLMHDTDSLVQEWGEEFYLLANDPTESRGPLFGDENRIVGRGSDMVADLDLITALGKNHDIEKIPLPHSSGPFSLFHVTRPVD